jgi:hypothetical protein
MYMCRKKSYIQNVVTTCVKIIQTLQAFKHTNFARKDIYEIPPRYLLTFYYNQHLVEIGQTHPREFQVLCYGVRELVCDSLIYLTLFDIHFSYLA